MTEQVAADTTQAAYDVRQIVEGCKSINGLGPIVMPQVFAFLFPKEYIYFWNRCVELVSGERGFPKFALGIPRGHAKTIFLKLFIVFIILFTKRKFILVVCASQQLADAILGDVCDMLDGNNIRKLFGSYDSSMDYDRGDGKRFYFRNRTIILKARGQGSSFRGVNEKLARPDVMIFDDAQTKDCAESATQAKQFIEWFRGTAMKAKDPKFCFYLYVGNMYRKVVIQEASTDGRQPAIYGCNLKNLKNSRHWESIVVGAILEDGTALWEELQPLKQLLDEYEEDRESGVEEVFLAEVMNDDEAFNSKLFNPSLVPDYPFDNNVFPQGKCIIIDPSLGKKKSDDQVVGVLDVIDGLSCLTDLRTYQVSAPKLVMEIITRCLEENIPAIAVEGYAYQESLGQWFEHYIEELGITNINIIIINRGAQSKNSAILSMFKECMESDYHGQCELYLHPRIRGILYNEIKSFDPLKTDNVDNNLDVATYCNIVKIQHSFEIQTYLLEESAYKGRVIDSGMHYK